MLNVYTAYFQNAELIFALMLNVWKVDVSCSCNVNCRDRQKQTETDRQKQTSFLVEKKIMKKYIEMEVAIFVIVCISDVMSHVYWHL